jgi:hypothetical protein
MNTWFLMILERHHAAAPTTSLGDAALPDLP